MRIVCVWHWFVLCLFVVTNWKANPTIPWRIYSPTDSLFSQLKEHWEGVRVELLAAVVRLCWSLGHVLPSLTSTLQILISLSWNLKLSFGGNCWSWKMRSRGACCLLGLLSFAGHFKADLYNWLQRHHNQKRTNVFKSHDCSASWESNQDPISPVKVGL